MNNITPTNLLEVDKYRDFIKVPKPIEIEPELNFLGWFPYRVVTLLGDDVISINRDEYTKLEHKISRKCSMFFQSNKYLLVFDKYCLYLHDLHGRIGSYENIKDYDFHDTRPIYKEEKIKDYLKVVPHNTLTQWRISRGIIS